MDTERATDRQTKKEGKRQKWIFKDRQRTNDKKDRQGYTQTESETDING